MVLEQKVSLKINNSHKHMCIPPKKVTLTFKFEATCHVIQIVKNKDKSKKSKLNCMLLLNKEHVSDTYSHPWKECREPNTNSNPKERWPSRKIMKSSQNISISMKKCLKGHQMKEKEKKKKKERKKKYLKFSSHKRNKRE